MHHRRFSGGGHRRLVTQQRRHRFESHTKHNILSVGDAPLYPPAVVCHRGEIGFENVVELRSAQRTTGKTVSIFEALGRVDAQHRRAQLRVELVKHRRAPSRRTIAHHTFDHAAHRIAFGTHLEDQALHLGRHRLIGAAHGVRLDRIERQLVIITIEYHPPHLSGPRLDVHAQIGQ